LSVVELARDQRGRATLLHERARAMRHALTPSEARLWSELRSRKLRVLFRRQVPIGEYIVDFLAPAARLIVEVDGGYHTRRLRVDARRERALTQLGYRVLRVEAACVLRELAVVVALIRATL
jgi:very-short-patch-repair endonuclease